MRRREFITLIGGATAWPLAARAQQSTKMPAIGVLSPGRSEPPDSSLDLVNAFLQGLQGLGYIEGRIITVERQFAQWQQARLRELAADLVARKVDVLVANSTTAALAAKEATGTIPIVAISMADPVADELVASLARPGGNVTGLSTLTPDLAGKRLELLREMVPGIRRLAFLANISNPITALERRHVQAAAAALGFEVVALEIRRGEDISPVLETLKGRAHALYVAGDPLILTNRVRINTWSLVAQLPAIYNSREYVEAAGLMSYGVNWPDLFRRSAEYVDKILRGAKPADIPVEQPTKFDLVINLTTAKALGLNIAESFLARADEVIE